MFSESWEKNLVDLNVHPSLSLSLSLSSKKSEIKQCHSIIKLTQKCFRTTRLCFHLKSRKAKNGDLLRSLMTQRPSRASRRNSKVEHSQQSWKMFNERKKKTGLIFDTEAMLSFASLAIQNKKKVFKKSKRSKKLDLLNE